MKWTTKLVWDAADYGFLQDVDFWINETSQVERAEFASVLNRLDQFGFLASVLNTYLHSSTVNEELELSITDTLTDIENAYYEGMLN